MNLSKQPSASLRWTKKGCHECTNEQPSTSQVSKTCAGLREMNLSKQPSTSQVFETCAGLREMNLSKQPSASLRWTKKGCHECTNEQPSTSQVSKTCAGLRKMNLSKIFTSPSIALDLTEVEGKKGCHECTNEQQKGEDFVF